MGNAHPWTHAQPLNHLNHVDAVTPQRKTTCGARRRDGCQESRNCTSTASDTIPKPAGFLVQPSDVSMCRLGQVGKLKWVPGDVNFQLIAFMGDEFLLV
jgi:hypothetical protein